MDNNSIQKHFSPFKISIMNFFPTFFIILTFSALTLWRNPNKTWKHFLLDALLLLCAVGVMYFIAQMVGKRDFGVQNELISELLIIIFSCGLVFGIARLLGLKQKLLAILSKTL